MKRYRELGPKMVNLTNRAYKSHETYMFLSKVIEESKKIVEEMLRTRSYLNEESENPCQVSILIRNQENESNVDTNNSGGAKGIKKRECSYKGLEK